MNLIKKTALLFLLLPALNAFSQDNVSYQRPPQSIIDLAEAPVNPVVRISSSGEWMLLLESAGLPSIKEVSQPELRLAGLRINPANNGKSRSAYYHTIRLKSIDKNEDYAFEGMPEEPQLADITWSPDEDRIAFTNSTDAGIELWIADIKTKTASKLTALYLYI
jgi:hypothetical protein